MILGLKPLVKLFIFGIWYTKEKNIFFSSKIPVFAFL